RCNHRGGRPILWKDLHDQYAKRQVCLILRGVCEIPCFKIVLASFIDRLLASLSECKLAGNHISNSGANVVMYSDVAVWGKREFGGSYFELTVKLRQVAKDDLLDLDLRGDTSCLHGFLSRQPVCSAKTSINCTPNFGAASLSESWNKGIAWLNAGLNITATRVTLGAISLSSSSHFAPTLGSKFVKPVMLPPG